MKVWQRKEENAESRVSTAQKWRPREKEQSLGMWAPVPSEGPSTWPEELREGKRTAIQEGNGCAPETKMSRYGQTS